MKRFALFPWTCLVLIALTAWSVASTALAADQIADAGNVLPVLLVGGFINIRGLFTRDAIANYLTQLPVITTPVMDTVFTHRPQIPLAMVGADIVKAVVRAMPLVQRGGRSITIGGGAGGVGFYEPFPIRPDISVTGADLNNLKIIQGDKASLDMWAKGKTEILRGTVRSTTEAMCAVSMSGTLSWPVALEGGGFETYTVVFGSVQTFAPAKKWDANGAKLKDVFMSLRGMHKKLKEKGYGGKVVFWAGEAAYNALFALAESFVSTAQLRVEVSDQWINVGGYLVVPRDELYFNPQSKTMIPVVANNVVKAIALDAGHQMPYCAIDDLDGNLQPMPLFVKPIPTQNPSGYQLVAESKPFPIPNVDGICDAEVTG